MWLGLSSIDFTTCIDVLGRLRAPGESGIARSLEFLKTGWAAIEGQRGLSFRQFLLFVIAQQLQRPTLDIPTHKPPMATAWNPRENAATWHRQ